MKYAQVVRVDASHCVAERPGALVVLWRATPEASRIAAVRGLLEARLGRGPIGLVVALEGDVGFPAAAARAEGRTMMKSVGRSLSFFCVLHPGGSVLTDLLFATVRTLGVLGSTGRPALLTRNLDEGESFVASAFGGGLGRSEVVALFADLRAACEAAGPPLTG